MINVLSPVRELFEHRESVLQLSSLESPFYAFFIFDLPWLFSSHLFISIIYSIILVCIALWKWRSAGQIWRPICLRYLPFPRQLWRSCSPKSIKSLWETFLKVLRCEALTLSMAAVMTRMVSRLRCFDVSMLRDVSRVHPRHEPLVACKMSWQTYLNCHDSRRGKLRITASL